MIAAAWIALFAPAAAVVAIALAGTGITRSVAGFLAAGSALGRYVRDHRGCEITPVGGSDRPQDA